MSTTRSGEEYPGPGSTLSFSIVRFDLSWPGITNLAMNYRLIGLREALALLHPWSWSREWLCFEPHGPIGTAAADDHEDERDQGCREGVPRVVGMGPSI